MTYRIFLLLCVSCWLLAACSQPEPDVPTATATTAVVEVTTTVPTTSPQPEPTPNLGNLLVPFSDEENGYTLDFPDTWLTGTEPFQFFTSTEAYTDGIDAGETGALVVALPLPPSLYAGESLFAVLDDVVDRFPIASELVAAEDAALQSVNGQEAATVTLTGVGGGVEPYTAVYTVMRTEAQVLALIGTAPSAQFAVYADTLSAVAGSVVLTKPLQNLGTAVVPLTTMPSSDGSLQVSYPLAWAAVEAPGVNNGFSLLLATREDLLLTGAVSEADDVSVTVSYFRATDFAEIGLDPDAEPATQLRQMADFLDFDLEMGALAGIETGTINGRGAATISFQPTATAQFGRLTVISDSEQAAVVVGRGLLANRANVDPSMAQIANSVRFGPPLAANAGEYQGEAPVFSFRYPAAWALNDSDPTSLLLAINEQAIVESDYASGGLVFVFAQEFSEARPAEEIATLFTAQFAALFSESRTLVDLQMSERNGNEVATLVQAGLLDGNQLLLTYTAVVRGSASLLSLGLTPADNWGAFYPEQEAIVRSLVLGEPE